MNSILMNNLKKTKKNLINFQIKIIKKILLYKNILINNII